MKTVAHEIPSRCIKLTCVHEEREVGRVFLYLLHNDLHNEPIGYIEDVFVEKECRNKGVWEKLRKLLIEKAKQEKCYKLIANSRFSKQEIHEMYLRMGFEKHGYEFRMDM